MHSLRCGSILTSALQGLAESSSRPPPLSDPPAPSDVWYSNYPPSAAQVEVDKTPHPPDISASSMIGPTSTFYSPEDTSLQQDLDHSQYQQWIEGYGPQQQQNQQIQQHYPQQMVYDTTYHDSLHVPIPLPYQFTQPQYETSSSLSQYDGSTTGTVTQSNVGQNRDNSYQLQSNVYPQVYPEIMAMKHSAPSTHERIPEVVSRSHSTPSTQGAQQGVQQNPSQQSRQQQVRPKPLRAPKAQQTQFLAHPSSSEFTSSNPSPSHSSSLIPPSIVWSTEPGYSNPTPIENANLGAQSSFRVPSSNSGSSRPTTSRNTPTSTNSPNPYPGTSGALGSSPRTSPPRTNDSTAVSDKTGHKSKKRKKNDPAQLSGAGGESDFDSDEDERMVGGISVGMGGLGVVGKGTATKGSRL